MNSKIKEIFVKKKPVKDFEISTHISLTNKYVFVQISKAASSNVKWTLQSLECKHSPWKVIDVNNKFFSPHISPYQITNEMLEGVFNSEEYKRVTFVRNPYSRILSCYLHRIVAEPESPSNKTLMKMTEGRVGADVSFDEFVEIICGQSSYEQEAHWRCQSEDICFDSVSYDLVGKLENLQSDLLSCVEMLYGKRGKEWFLNSQKKDASEMKTGASELVKQYYNNFTMNKVRKRFSVDFSNFKYSQNISNI